MSPFQVDRVSNLKEALQGLSDARTVVIAGGTELLNWMKEGIVAPARLIDINSIAALREIHVKDSTIRLGSLARMSEIATHETILRDYPAIAEALLASASPQIRNMASIGGNLMQRTRCPYFRADVDLPCNKRVVGSGCSAALAGDAGSALFGGNEHCVATHPSDVAVALTALDATIEIASLRGSRSLPLADFYRLPDGASVAETNLRPGEVITSITVPSSVVARTSRYLKVRERSSYEFAIVSSAAAIQLQGERIEDVRIALGGVAHKPWRLKAAEDAMRGTSLSDRAALHNALAGALADARTNSSNHYKVELAIRAAIRAIELAGEAA